MSTLCLHQLQSPQLFLCLELRNEVCEDLSSVMTRSGPGGCRGTRLMSWGEGRTGEGSSGEMTSTPGMARWAGRCCYIQGLDTQSLGWTALWSWLSKSLWGWCEFFSTLCPKILHYWATDRYNFSLPQRREEKSSVSNQLLKGMSHQEEHETCLVESCSQWLAGESLLQVPQGTRVLNSGRKREKGEGWESLFLHSVSGLPPRSLLHPHLSLLSLMELGQPPLDLGKSLLLEAKRAVFVPRAPAVPSPLQPGSAHLLGSTSAKLNRIALFPL